ncbi:hypothetical protein LCGC14_1003020 [marine sediment metagenome]|uniref:Uncharacterized protein n=1 Tax=marine sediment metagenome TaxID=412755 RepID=A0A0F9NNW0_9ZZZZ
MALVCQDCGSPNVVTNGEAPPDDWYSILVTLSDRVPSEDHCQAWLDSKGIPDEVAEQTATSMLASLRYDKKLGVWKRGKTEYVQIWATFRSWCLRDLRQNGQRPGTSMKVKEGY